MVGKVLFGNIRELYFYPCSSFFKAGDYEAAINALSQAICLNPMLPVYPLYITIYVHCITVHCV